MDQRNGWRERFQRASPRRAVNDNPRMFHLAASRSAAQSENGAGSSLRRPQVEGRSARLWPRFWAVVLWLSAGASLGFWVTRSPGSVAVALPTPESVDRSVDSRSVARALGADAAGQRSDVVAVAETPAPWALTGVIAAPNARGSGAQGIALLARPGERSQPVAVGALLDGGWRVDRIESRRVVLVAEPAAGAAAAGSQRVLELPDAPNPLFGPAGAGHSPGR